MYGYSGGSSHFSTNGLGVFKGGMRTEEWVVLVVVLKILVSDQNGKKLKVQLLKYRMEYIQTEEIELKY